MTPLPHSSQFNAAMAKLVAAAVKENRKSISFFSDHERMKQLYRMCSAMDAIINGIDDKRSKPSLQSARSIVIQLPVLLLFSFCENGLVELRRFLELLFWGIYFRDHPVEWERFSADPETGFSRAIEQPIEFSARRELVYYVNYARDLLGKEPSGHAIRAIDSMLISMRNLNAKVHAASFANATKRELRFKVDGAEDAKKLCEITHAVFRDAAIILCATQRKRFDALGVVPRAYFDQLIGSKLAKKIRSGDFGLPVR